MSEELQGESVEVEQVADTQPESNQELEQSPDEGSDLASDTVAEQSTKTEFSDDQQQVINRMKAKDTFKFREAERQSQAREAELQRQLSEFQNSQPLESAPVAPELPDQFDDDYDGKMAAYKKALVAEAVHGEQQKYAQTVEQNRQQKEYLDQQKVQRDAGEKFTANGKKLGITPDKMQQNAEVVNTYGLDIDLIMHIAQDSQGPAIIQHLANHPEDAQTLLNAGRFGAGTEVESIKGRLKKNVTKAPKPAETLRGNGVPEKEDPRLKGAIFE